MYNTFTTALTSKCFSLINYILGEPDYIVIPQDICELILLSVFESPDSQYNINKTIRLLSVTNRNFYESIRRKSVSCMLEFPNTVSSNLFYNKKLMYYFPIHTDDSKKDYITKLMTHPYGKHNNTILHILSYRALSLVEKLITYVDLSKIQSLRNYQNETILDIIFSHHYPGYYVDHKTPEYISITNTIQNMIDKGMKAQKSHQIYISRYYKNSNLSCKLVEYTKPTIQNNYNISSLKNMNSYALNAKDIKIF